jgi:hypothetical protein
MVAVLTTYAGMSCHHHDGAIAATLHHGAHTTAPTNS